MLQLLKLAAEAADLRSDINRKAFVGSVAVRQDGKIVHARNLITPMPTQKVPNAHSEFLISRKMGIGATIYVARVLRDGSLAMAKPCPTCYAMLRSKRVEAIYWTVSNNDWDGIRL